MKNIKSINEWKDENDYRPIISFDFDGVIHKSVIEGTTHPINYDQPTTWKPFEKMHSLLWELSETHRIIVMTKRTEYMRKDTQYYIDAYGLPVETLYCTGGRDKWDLLEELGAIRHYDDDEYMIDEYNGDPKECPVKLILVNVDTEELTPQN
jgi:hypothetical protein